MPLLVSTIRLAGVAGCGGGGSGAKTPTATAPAPKAPANVKAAAATQGKALYSAKGCRSCHSIDGSTGTGPTWKGLAGSSVKLTTGRTVTANEPRTCCSRSRTPTSTSSPATSQAS